MKGGWDRTHDCGRTLWVCNLILVGSKNVTHWKIERGRGLGVAKEGDIADGDNEYAVGNDGNYKPLAEGNNDDDDEYSKDGDIANKDDEYAIGNDSVNKPLAEGNNKHDTLNAARAQA